METSEKYLNRTAQILLAGLLVGLILAAALAGGKPVAPGQLGLILGFAVVSTLVSQARSLQLQNVLTVAALIFGLAGIVQFVGVVTGIPFGPLIFTDNLGELLFDQLPWTAPLLWVVALLNCRSTARLLLRPWRKLRLYGFQVIVLTCGLMVLFDAALEPFATRVHRFWLWRVAGGGPSMEWFAAPAVNFLGWAVTTVVILLVTTPWLINKLPGKRRPADYHPFILWLALNLFLAASLARHQFWLPAGITFAVSGIGSLFAWRNRA